MELCATETSLLYVSILFFFLRSEALCDYEVPKYIVSMKADFLKLQSQFYQMGRWLAPGEPGSNDWACNFNMCHTRI